MSELPAGRELDALVAECVFGLAFRPYPKGSVADQAGWEFQSLMVDDAVHLAPEHYSTDIAAAWQVVEKIGLSVVNSDDGWYAVEPSDILHSHLRGTDHPTITLLGAEGVHFAPSETAPLAICRAALVAVRAERSEASTAPNKPTASTE